MAAEFNPLYSAVEAGQLEDVRALLAAGAAQYLNLGHADAPYGGTLLHLAARNNDGEIAQQLLHHGAAVGAKDCRGRTPLHVAASWGSTAVMAQLLRAGADPQACDAKGNTPLLLAFSNGMAAAAGLLLDSGAPMDQLYGGDKLFLRNGTPLTINNDQYTLLHAACKWGNLDMLRALLDAGTCVDQPCAYGSTPLWVACQHNREQLLEELLSRGADATIPDNDRWTPLHIACKHKCVKVVKRLLLLPEVLAAVDAANSEGATALYLAAEAGYGEVVSLLVTAGANPHPRVTRDLHPLYAAISHGQSAVASQLLEAGARINGRARDGRTFLHAAIERKQLAVVRQLLALGADPGVAAADGTNSLHAATSANHACILEVLLAAVAAGRSCAGVDAEVRGMTALHLAFEKKHWDCIKVLLAAGADPGKLYGPGAGEWEGASLLHRAVQVGKKGAAAAVPLLATPTTLRHIWEGQTPLHLALTLNKVSVARALVEAGAPPGLHNKAGSTALALAAQRSTRVQIRRLLPAMVRSDCKLYQQEQSQQQQAQQLGQQQQQHGQQQGQAQAPRQQQGQAQQQDNQARDMTAVLADARLALNDVLRHGDMAVGIDCIAAVLEVLGGAAARSLVREVMLQHNTWLWADLLVDLNERIIRMVHSSWMAALQPLLARREQVSKLQRLVLLLPQQLGGQEHDSENATATAAAVGSGDAGQSMPDVVQGLHTQCLAAAGSGQWATVVQLLAQLAAVEQGQSERLARLKSVLSVVAGSTPQLMVRNVRLAEFAEALVAAWGTAQHDTPACVQREVTETVLAAVQAWQMAWQPRRPPAAGR